VKRACEHVARLAEPGCLEPHHVHGAEPTGDCWVWLAGVAGLAGGCG
jgi:hypothetical protein